jgi:hypothetical protein
MILYVTVDVHKISAYDSCRVALNMKFENMQHEKSFNASMYNVLFVCPVDLLHTSHLEVPLRQLI